MLPKPTSTSSTAAHRTSVSGDGYVSKDQTPQSCRRHRAKPTKPVEPKWTQAVLPCAPRKGDCRCTDLAHLGSTGFMGLEAYLGTRDTHKIRLIGQAYKEVSSPCLFPDATPLSMLKKETRRGTRQSWWPNHVQTATDQESRSKEARSAG